MSRLVKIICIYTYFVHLLKTICKTGIYVKTIRIHEAEELFEVLFYYWVRVDSKRAAARQANRGTMPRVCVDHAPGFPPGAFCVGHMKGPFNEKSST